VKEIRA